MSHKYNIGIGVTVHNRHETANVTIANIKKRLPKGALLVIVDDNSEIPYPNATFRFEEQAGIAKAKNKCFELLDECEHIFLLDDDCWPKVDGWEKPYIESKHPHLMYIFSEFSNGRPNGNRKSHEIEDAVIFANPCGCMIYYHHSCLDAVGGMDEEYGIWGFDHPDHSVRIHNAGLTPYKFMDVKGSDDLFFSYDKEQTIERSVPASVRNKHIATNQRKYNQLGRSTKFIPYKKQTGIILTSYFTGVTDPQRGEKWEADVDKVSKLAESALQNECKLVVLHDCFTKDQIAIFKSNYSNVEFEDFGGSENPYFQRWLSYRGYLECRNYDNVCMVDATDVEVLRNPFQIIRPNTLYVGWENSTIGCPWMQNHHKSNFMQNFIKCNLKTSLLNAGVIGGRYDIVMEFLDAICDQYTISKEQHLEGTDMAYYNWTLYSHFNGRFETGLKVTTEFKGYKSNEISLFKHK